MPPSSNPRNEACSECGMANVGNEFHPHALCLLVKARGGDTTAARKDMAFILGAARSTEPFTQLRVSAFLKAVSEGA
jgi:hypothetical protein